MIGSILSYTALSRTATILLEDGSIISPPVDIDLTAMVGKAVFYENGLLLIPGQPPALITATDPAVVIDGMLIYNTTAGTFKTGSGGVWVAQKHNALDSLQGGAAAKYYHLTAAEQSQVAAGPPQIVFNTNDIFGVVAAGASGWTGTIATLPGGAPTTLTVTTVTGALNSLVIPNINQIGKQVLFNTTRGTYALVVQCVTSTSTITLTANVPAGWTVGDTITTLSPTFATAGYVEIEIIAGDLVGRTNVFVMGKYMDSGAAGQNARLHPISAFSGAKRLSVFTQASSVVNVDNMIPIQLTANRFSTFWSASGAATAQLYISQVGFIP